MDEHYGDLPTRLDNGDYEAPCSCGAKFVGSQLEARVALNAHLDQFDAPRNRYEAGANGRRFLTCADRALAEKAAYKLLDRESGEAWVLDRVTRERTVITDRRAIERRVEQAS